MFVFKENSKLISGLLLVIFILTGCGGADERKAKYLERAKTYFAEKNYDKARVEFKNVLQIDPKTPEPYYYLGQIEESNKEWRKAFGYFSKALEMDPELVDAMIRLGWFYVLSGNEDKAREQADEALSREPDNIDALALHAAILARQDAEEEAIQILQKILETNPGHARAVNTLVSIYREQDKHDEVIRILESAHEGDSNLTMILVNAYLKRDEKTRAEALMQGLIRDNPEDLTFRAALASYYSQSEQLDKAEQVLRDAIAADASDVQRYKLLVEFLTNRIGRDKAIEELRVIIDQQPEMPQLDFALADMYLRSGDAEKAESVYLNVISKEGTKPYGLTARTAIAELRFQQNNLDEAKALVKEVLAENSKDSKAQSLKGRIALREGAYPDAIATFRSVLNDQPDSVELLTLLAGAHQANGENELALETLYKAVLIEPDNIDARLRLGNFLLLNNEPNDALEQVDAVLEMDDSSISALRIKAEILAQLGLTDELEKILTRIEQAAPASGLGSFGKGRLYRSQGKNKEARAAFKEALAHEPDSVLALTELVNTEISMGDHESAIELLNGILKDNPEHRIAHDLLGIVYVQKQDFAKAEAEFSKQLEINKNSSTVYLQLATVRLEQGDMKSAVKTIEQGLEVLPNDARLLLGLARIYRSRGDLDAAASTLQRGIDSAPDNPAFAIGLAVIQESRSEYDSAIATYEKLLENRPDHLLAVNNLAALLADHKQDEQSLLKAKELASRLVETNQPALLDTLGWVHYRLGEYKDAAAILASVVEQSPDVPIFGYHLGMAYYKQGDPGAAREILAKVVADEYNYTGVEEARRVFAEINK